MLFKRSLFCLTLLLLLSALNVDAKKNKTNKYREHKRKHNITTLNDELDTKAETNFAKTDDLIENFNSLPGKLMELDHNELSLKSPEEIATLRGFVVEPGFSKRAVGSSVLWSSFNGVQIKVPMFYYTVTPGYTPRASVDWTQNGYNTSVRNQQTCGDCYAFASVAALEASISINLNQAVVLSPQQITDCATQGNNGCNGGFSITVYNYGFQNGFCSDSYYPFVSRQQTCSHSGSADKTHGNLFTVSKIYLVDQKNDQALMEALDKLGPIAIGMDASSPYFNSYKSGIFASPKSPAGVMCNASNIDHAMLLVGYGVDSTTGEKYWRIKNQWGSTWGENGYIRVSREVTNNCGISTWGVIPVAVAGATNPTTASTTTTTTTQAPTVAPPPSSLTCDGKIHADSGCKTGYSCGYNTLTSTCSGGMWSGATSSATCGPSYSSCNSPSNSSSCTTSGVFLTTSCTKLITCTLSKTVYNPPTAGQLLDDSGPYWRTGWTCPK